MCVRRLLAIIAKFWEGASTNELEVKLFALAFVYICVIRLFIGSLVLCRLFDQRLSLHGDTSDFTQDSFILYNIARGREGVKFVAFGTRVLRLIYEKPGLV